MASTHELMQLEELTTAALVLARMDLGDPEARVVSHWIPTKYFVGKLPEVIRVELRVGDRVIANSEAAVAPFADGDARAAKDVEARQIAGRRTAITSVIQELCERETGRLPKVGADAINGIAGSLAGSGVVLDEKSRTVTIPRDGLEEIFPDGMSPRMAQRVAMFRIGVPVNLIDTVLDGAPELNDAARNEPVEARVVRVGDLGMVFGDEDAAEKIALLKLGVPASLVSRVSGMIRSESDASALGTKLHALCEEFVASEVSRLASEDATIGDDDGAHAGEKWIDVAMYLAGYKFVGTGPALPPQWLEPSRLPTPTPARKRSRPIEWAPPGTPVSDETKAALDEMSVPKKGGKPVVLSKVLLKQLLRENDPVGPTDVASRILVKHKVDRRQAQNLLNGLKNRKLVRRVSERKVRSGHMEGLYALTKKGRRDAEGGSK